MYKNQMIIDGSESKALAVQLAKIIFEKYPQEPKLEDFVTMLGAIAILKDTFESVARNRGFNFGSFKMEEHELQ